MGFWQITLGDVIGYAIILSGFAITIKIHFSSTSHHNKKDVNKVNQAKSNVKGNQIGRDKK